MKSLDLPNFGSSNLDWRPALHVCLISFHGVLTASLRHFTQHKIHPFEVVQFGGYLVCYGVVQTSPQPNFRTLFITLKGNPIAISSHSPSPYNPAPGNH